MALALLVTSLFAQQNQYDSKNPPGKIFADAYMCGKKAAQTAFGFIDRQDILAEGGTAIKNACAKSLEMTSRQPECAHLGQGAQAALSKCIQEVQIHYAPETPPQYIK